MPSSAACRLLDFRLHQEKLLEYSHFLLGVQRSERLLDASRDKRDMVVLCPGASRFLHIYYNGFNCLGKSNLMVKFLAESIIASGIPDTAPKE